MNYGIINKYYVRILFIFRIYNNWNHRFQLLSPNPGYKPLSCPACFFYSFIFMSISIFYFKVYLLSCFSSSFNNVLVTSFPYFFSQRFFVVFPMFVPNYVAASTNPVKVVLKASVVVLIILLSEFPNFYVYYFPF